MNEQIIDFYVAHTTAKRGRIEAMMKWETRLNAAKALEAGIVSEVL